MAVPIIEDESINAISMQQDSCNEEISNKSEDKCFKIKAKKLDSRDKETAFDQQGVKTKESSHAVHFTILACVLTEMKRWLEYECNRQNPCKASYVKDFKREVLKYGIKYKERRKLKFIHNFVKSFYSIPKTYLHTFMLRAQEYNKFINEKTLQTMSCRDSMQFEWARLSSFANYPVTGPSAIRLAGAGFYYEGQEDEVVCYFCGYRHKQWNNKDDPRVIHKQQSPNCPFVKHNLSAVCARQMSLNEQTSECSGVSGMTETCLQQQTQISENHLYTCQCEKNDTIVNKRNSENEDEETRSLILETQNNSIINDQSNTTQTVVSEITQPTVLPTPASTTAVSKITQPTVLPTPAATTAVSEITQQTVLPTPAATTVVSEITQPTVLPTTTVSKITQPTVLPKPAATTAVSEITQPTVLPEPSTATIVSQITTSEADPYDIFNNGSRNNTSGLIRVNENASVQQPISEFILSQGPENLGICVDRPKYPSYAITANRLSSFAGWPEYIDQTPERLATAGFFYTGTGDHCRCFYCGGGLRQWEEEDLPWTEHARWYPNCPFVKQSKGHEFINAVLKGKDPERHQQRGTKNVNGYLNNPAVQTILDFGYDEDLVKRLYTSLNHSGIQDINASLLLETIFEMDESKRHSSTNEPTPFLNNKVPNENTGTKEATPPLNNNIPKENTGTTTKEPTPSLNNTISKENTGTKSNEKEHGVNTNVEHELSIRSLEEENRNLKDQQTCKICLDEPVAIVFLPCGHLAACVICAPALRKCPICRAFIRGTVKAIM